MIAEIYALLLVIVGGGNGNRCGVFQALRLPVFIEAFSVIELEIPNTGQINQCTRMV